MQNLKRIFSKTRTGPVLPRMVSGCPANSENATPVSDAPNSDSMALCYQSRERGTEGKGEREEEKGERKCD